MVKKLVHCDQRIYFDDPQPVLKKKQGKRGRKLTRLETQTPAIQVDEWKKQQPEAAWKRVKVRDSTCGEPEVEVLHRRVWLWDGEESQAQHWHLIMRREIDVPQSIKYTLSNALPETKLQRLAEMQAQRFWVERAFQDGKSECGMARLPSAQMTGLAPSYGFGFHGDAFHARREDTCRWNLSAVELFGH